MELPPLPPTAQVIAEIIGRDATLSLTRKAQHRAMYVPYLIRDNHWIAKTVGRAHADLLSRHLGGLHLPLAKCSDVIRAERDHNIRAAFKAGKTIEHLAERYRLSKDAIFDVLDSKRAKQRREQARQRMARLRAKRRAGAGQEGATA